MNRFLNKEQSEKLLQTLPQTKTKYTYDPEKHRIILHDKAGNEQVYFRLPITLSVEQQDLRPATEKVNYVVLLIQSGNCALGYFEDGHNLDHKVFRSYMVRKKQGKSQVKYLKTKGKSRAGSRVRLGETVEFFENINGRLQDYFEDYNVNRIAISCSKTLIPYLYGSRVSTPFDKNDPRLYKIPKHVHTPIYEVLLDTNRFLQKGELVFDAAGQDTVEALLTAAGISETTSEPDDLWDEDTWEMD